MTTRFLVGGNAFWGRYIDDWSKASDLGDAYPFSLLGTLHRERYDGWIVGLECPTDPDVEMTSAQMEAALVFNCPPRYLPEAAKWFTAFTLASNHTDNQGADGFEATKKELDKVGIQYFGHYDPNELDELCDVVVLPATVGFKDAGDVPSSAAKRQANAEIPIAMCGYHGVFQIPSQESLDVIGRYSDLLPVIAFPHMGAEYTATPDGIKTATYRGLIDAGADMVLGDHPHWVQTTEAYQGKLIVYSLGNFLFDQQNDAERTRAALVDITARSFDPEAVEGWTAIAGQCREEGIGACHDLARERGLPRLALDYTYSVVATTNADRRTRKASKDELASVKDRMGWESTMAALAAD